ncbi:hypothetical protein E0Z10_g4410 [Xylaria hypoxylon]|uniref:J domain-containing protein n=1 Tax=Xylaria hypoxylon TaxID=37992 RepID=A0A4Z0Z6Z2_9PEZI|nr:hypothetical protein E0Z10_g4410 [Xylaria hypoxylon]
MNSRHRVSHQILPSGNSTSSDLDTLTAVTSARDRGMWVNWAGFTLRDQLSYLEDPEPLQLKYRPANCRIYWTIDNVLNFTRLWSDVAAAIWDDQNLCVDGSARFTAKGGSNDTKKMPPSRLFEAPLPPPVAPGVDFDASTTGLLDTGGGGNPHDSIFQHTVSCTLKDGQFCDFRHGLYCMYFDKKDFMGDCVSRCSNTNTHCRVMDQICDIRFLKLLWSMANAQSGQHSPRNFVKNAVLPETRAFTTYLTQNGSSSHCSRLICTWQILPPPHVEEMAPSQVRKSGVKKALTAATSQSNQGAYGYASLRSAASRFSLHEQFAATRRELEFGYDDASSIWERSTVRSHVPNDEIDAAGIPNTEGITHLDPVTLPPLSAGDFYDILCLSHDPPVESVHRAYLRLFSLLDPDKQPPYLRHISETYFTTIQRAFETLIDPCQRMTYDLACYDGDLASINATGDPERHGYNSWMSQMTRHPAIIDGGLSMCELGARVDVQHATRHRKQSPWPGGISFELVDFEMRHSTSMDLIKLDWQIRRTTQWLQHKLTTRGDTAMDVEYSTCSKTGRLDGTVMTLQGSVYGFLQDRAVVTLPSDRYQVSLPRTANRDQFILLRNGLIRPFVAVNLRHVIPQSSPSRYTIGAVQTSTLKNGFGQEEAVVEIESTVLPDLVTTIRLSKPIVLPSDRLRSLLILEMEQTLQERKFPRLAATLERPTSGGQLRLHIAGGDWRNRLDGTCNYFADFTRTNGRFLGLGLLSELSNGLSTPKSRRVEIAFKNRGTFVRQESCITNRPLNQGIYVLDSALDDGKEGTWTVTALAEPRYYSVSAKYARDVNLPSLPLNQPRSVSPTTHNPLSTEANSTFHRRLRMETEIGVDSLSAGYLAFRCLKPVGRFSRVGFEIGLSTHSLHLSLYWSRLSQRINAPFYLCSRSSVDLKILLLTTVIPFASFALWELWDRYRHRKRCQRRLDALQEQQHIQKYRAEADILMTLMAPAVQSKQKLESMENGLVILSAKYGVKARDAGHATAWGAAEVADVTVAVAALIDRGQLFIPSRVRKSYILGFWDPDPAEEKVLHIRYSYQGREDIVEVRGDDEQLVLPPLSLS